MPVAKSLLALLIAGLLAFLGYFFMFRDDSNRAVSGAEADRFMQGSRNTPRNNDDPNYAEELRQNAALVENTLIPRAIFASKTRHKCELQKL